jgi:tetratricopeptide (TPR) repeat protein
LNSDVERLVSQKHPGVTLESEVQGWVFLREFEAGLACYESIQARTGVDDRWAGICYFHLHQDMRAVELFYRAIARGVDSARINLAHALGYIERGDEVLPELLRVDSDRLSIYDKVLFYRVKSLHEETNGDLRTALQDAEKAWNLVQATPQFSILAPDILSQLAVLHGRIGRAQAALSFIDKNLSIATGVDGLRARIHRAHILITFGKFSQALLELDLLDLTIAPRYLHAIVRVYRGEAEWGLNNLATAMDHFEAAAELAVELEIGFEEFLARVELAVLHANANNLDSAHEYLRDAERLVSDRSDRLYFRFREILTQRLSNSIDGMAAVAELNTVADELGKMGALEEQGRVRLHIAHELWRQGSSEYLRELSAIDDLAGILQNPSFMSRELVLLPDFAPILCEASYPHIAAGHSDSGVLVVESLGAERLVFNAKQTLLPLRRAVELFAYFLQHQRVELNRVIVDLFPDEKPKTAKSYFHQFRYQLARTIPGVAILFDRHSRQYWLSTSISVIWDVDEIRRGAAKLDGRRFLPSSSSNWVETLNQELAQLRTADKVGAR